LFTPRIITFSSKGLPKEIMQKNCFSNGEYCPYNPKHHGAAFEEETPGNLLNAF
jgi:hypothetical protein